tara:strand:- start:12158 stop:12319 length:162 start_codon:yes stop_codon:yes gene_type:complete
MTDDELNRLITAVETDNEEHFHGDAREGIVEALKELRATREQLEEIRYILKPD